MGLPGESDEVCGKGFFDCRHLVRDANEGKGNVFRLSIWTSGQTRTTLVVQ